MTLSFYLIIQEIIMGVIMALGCLLIFDAIPIALKSENLYVSTKIMGVGISVVPIVSFIYYFLKMEQYGAQVATAVNLSAYCLTSVLISSAYLVLLVKIKKYRCLCSYLSIGVMFPIPLWLCMCFTPDCIKKHALIVAYTFFVVLVIMQSISCIKHYRELLQSDDSDTPSQTKAEHKWLGRTLYTSLALMVTSIFSPSFFSYPLWLGLIFIIIFIFCSIAIFVCYRKMIAYRISLVFNIKEDKIVDDEETEEEVIEEEVVSSECDTIMLSDDIKQHIEKHLTSWLKDRKYTQQNININSVSKEVYTNRTYLSRYINAVYGCSFRVWITQLRIEESKRLLVEQPDLSINDIATQIGASSQESFSHTFTSYVKVSPSKWREENTL